VSGYLSQLGGPFTDGTVSAGHLGDEDREAGTAVLRTMATAMGFG
jgi:hypothetical protein